MQIINQSGIFTPGILISMFYRDMSQYPDAAAVGKKLKKCLLRHIEFLFRSKARALEQFALNNAPKLLPSLCHC